MRDRISVLFVCLGNICRSPMAEAVFRHIVRSEGLEDRFHIDSAGTGDWHIGQPPHKGTRQILDQYRISHEGLQARQVHTDDFSNFKYIIAMDSKNVADLQGLVRSSQAKIIKLLDLIPGHPLQDVPDPYFTGNFEETYQLVSVGCQALLQYILKNEAESEGEAP